MRQYCYSPLPQKSNVTRLLKLLPSRDKADVLRGELIEYTLPNADSTDHAYEALSYVWGDNKNSKLLILTQHGDHQGAQLEITQNLFAALLHLRHHQFPRILWVDAVCINQSSHNEKQIQIQFMSVIYAKARTVLVWLGETEDGGSEAIEYIRAAGENFGIQDNISSPRRHSLAFN